MKVIIDNFNPKEITVTNKNGFRYLDKTSIVTDTKEFDIETEDDCIIMFETFYKWNNSLRYCNGSYWKFRDNKIDIRYKTWYNSLKTDTTFKMYYGNGTVD